MKKNQIIKPDLRQVALTIMTYSNIYVELPVFFGCQNYADSIKAFRTVRA